jgi:hypothetical protein
MLEFCGGVKGTNDAHVGACAPLNSINLGEALNYDLNHKLLGTYSSTDWDPSGIGSSAA